MATKPRLGPMRERLAFDPVLATTDGYGNTEDGWDTDNRVIRQAEVVYRSGGEREAEGRATGRGVYKVRIAQSPAAAAITTDWRMTDLRTSVSYDLIEVDALSDRNWIWLVAETQTGVDL